MRWPVTITMPSQKLFNFFLITLFANKPFTVILY